ncbi:DUF2726 domain-containing protein [Beijerinckia indica]|uniref:DUF2726 domain-containing protein n=1 Tax=Beijerinckia indica subsp. indica (strain ATCC 9039 / DSM 1715 / NCIMB 8712) TaxID=395963 RepID=B2ILK0_BEII9|nr:DUF2726 domain-containing protein [Beijerinckia indica]ACB97400.1 hypothetical protein Bind_3871 [Beijerinckia indica subsp. indica ATCC 9039]
MAPQTLIFILEGLAIGLACLFLLSKFGKPAFPYQAKTLLTAWEINALKELVRTLPPSLHPCPQVRLADLVMIKQGLSGRHRFTALNRVAAKSVDFVILEHHTGRIVLVIELDDKTHARRDRRVRDRFVDDVLNRCAIPLLRVKPGESIASRVLSHGALLP